jgi:hypothetical protein
MARSAIAIGASLQALDRVLQLPPNADDVERVPIGGIVFQILHEYGGGMEAVYEVIFGSEEAR